MLQVKEVEKRSAGIVCDAKNKLSCPFMSCSFMSCPFVSCSRLPCARRKQVTLRAEGCSQPDSSASPRCSHIQQAREDAGTTSGKYAEIEIPGFKRLFLANLVLDYNGTLACDGKVITGVGERLEFSPIVFRCMS